MNDLPNAELLARAVTKLDEVHVRVGASRTDNWRTVDRLARELGLTDAADIDRLNDLLRAHEEQAVRSGNPGQARVRRAKYPDRTTALDLWGSVKQHGPPWTTKERQDKPDAESVSLRVSDDAPSAFLSHTHHDRQLALSLATALAAEGIGSWRFETDIEEGDNIARCVREALETSDCLVVLVTEYSIASLWVLTEMQMSVGLDTPIAAVLDTTNPLWSSCSKRSGSRV